ncbi:MAG TPA: electron transfer flavoprotein-ubiquinone oxidoreductase, partial [Phenylobacterium sp.]|nr:electron transfer flavoprotein-ubiquinone oxidoreductase [Phenylobacterium sp.]
VIVGGGPSGLSAAIRLKQLAAAAGQEVTVCLIEKGSEVGAHILSGAVVDPSTLNDLLPDWKAQGAPMDQPVTGDEFWYLGPQGDLHIPNFIMPPLMHNHGNYIVSLGNVCRWLAQQAEALGVDIFPGFAGAEVLYNADGSVKGVATGDMGVTRSGEPGPNFAPGAELHAKYTLFAEGARGSLTKTLIKRFDLEKDSEPQKYGLGIKELWQVDPAKHRPGFVAHTLGFPFSDATGGGWIYHMAGGLVSIGLVTHLNYSNPYLSPFDEFQRFKNHPKVRPLLEGGQRIAYGARTMTSGGVQSMPKLSFPGGALIGCAAGVVNMARIKGTHNAMRLGMLGAEAAFEAIAAGRANDELADLNDRYKRSSIFKDLNPIRNLKPLLGRYGTLGGMLLGGMDMWFNVLFRFSPFGTLKHGKADYQTLKPAKDCTPIVYPKPDGVVTFDKLSSVFLSATNHEEDQPIHLRLRDPGVPIAENLPRYAEPARLYCPAAVYEVLYDENGANPRFQINAQNCVHCKTCDIKDPAQNIDWTVPQGGEGPNYGSM